MVVKEVERALFGHHKALVAHRTLGAFLVALVFVQIIVQFRFIDIADIF